jgi:hypothetical protein
MNKILLLVIGFLALGAAWAMRIIGGRSSHLSELREYWWVPLPLGLVCFLAASKKKPADNSGK